MDGSFGQLADVSAVAPKGLLVGLLLYPTDYWAAVQGIHGEGPEVGLESVA